MFIDLKSILTVIGVEMIDSYTWIAELIDASMVAALGSPVIELSKVASITNCARADKPPATTIKSAVRTNRVGFRLENVRAG